MTNKSLHEVFEALDNEGVTYEFTVTNSNRGLNPRITLTSNPSSDLYNEVEIELRSDGTWDFTTRMSKLASMMYDLRAQFHFLDGLDDEELVSLLDHLNVNYKD